MLAERFYRDFIASSGVLRGAIGAGVRALPLAVVLGLAHVTVILAQPSIARAFEVASIKVCKQGDVAPGVEVRSSGNGKTAGGDNSTSPSPGRLSLNCSTLK